LLKYSLVLKYLTLGTKTSDEPYKQAQQQPSASLPRASRRDKEKPDTKNAEKRAALDVYTALSY
jgi:hypothetical protein